ncbi:T9SS type A sorting domain-containing protein [Moheibacter lacus]|uniref:T9SS type A sorting domain-containing protein n=1 Tax=Moheibacter lacus TaxID=2745851 RepID=A0A838ZSS3_9FLAO|nr:T9SS type A sorting domain-containing protein [Moheibacter lacus]MBA5630027.1 T9SS type A sorting domain-containing protein [Moheibacter lacus]
MKSTLLFSIVLFCSIPSHSQYYNYYLYHFPYQDPFVPNEEIPFVKFSIGDENDYTYLETEVCQYRKVRIDYCLCWDPEFHIIEILEESGEPCENQENQSFEQDYLSNFDVDRHWYYWDENLDNGAHLYHLTASLVPGQPYISYSNTLMNTTDMISPEKIEIYPNPASNSIQFSEKIKKLVVFDLSGKIQIEKDLILDELDISDLPKGTYIIKGYKENGKFFTAKFMKN